jgi:hypothetical protein
MLQAHALLERVKEFLATHGEMATRLGGVLLEFLEAGVELLPDAVINLIGKMIGARFERL